MRCRSLTPPLQWVWVRSSSVVEQPAVNRRVVGSNPTCGANVSYGPSYTPRGYPGDRPQNRVYQAID